MPLSQETLSLMFQGDKFSEEAPAIGELASLWQDYLEGASVSGVSASPTVLATTATPVFAAALIGISVSPTGLQQLVDAMVASWAVLATGAATVFVGAPITGPGTPPTALPSASTALAPILVANQAQALSQADAADAIAAVLHPLNLGALVPSGPITLPIL